MRQPKRLYSSREFAGTRHCSWNYCRASQGRVYAYSHNYEFARWRRSRKIMQAFPRKTWRRQHR